MYEFLNEFMGFTLTANQVYFFGCVFITIFLIIIYKLFEYVIKLFN